MKLRDIVVFDETNRLFMISVRLTRKSDDHIGSDREKCIILSRDLVDSFESIDEHFSIVFSVHSLQYCIRSRLDGQVKVRVDAILLIKLQKLV